ncbi:MAG TPA: fatty acid desaturase [Acidimicrobiales bacterium]|nr:fatty acid desaturase [Acidimicrobiales bacterium]
MPAPLLALLVGIVTSQIANLATTLYLHRGVSHRAVTFSPGVTLAFRVIVWLTTGIKPREWAAVHRRHHAFSDVEGDPHSPVLLGWVRVQLTNATLYRRAARDGVTVPRYARDLAPDRWDRALFDRGWLGLGIGLVILVLLLGPLWGSVAAATHLLLYLSLSAAINAVTHTFGARPYDNQATNLQWLAWLTGGEGLHNNHHAAPTTARMAHRPGEYDLAWPVIRALRRLGWAQVRHEKPPVRQPARARAGSGAGVGP